MDLIRMFENTKYFGYMFYLSYNGNFFDSFDENKGLKSVKSEFKKLLEKNEIKIYKGIQQAGRTDAGVHAENNILYINSKQDIDFKKLKFKKIDGMEINKVEKTIPNLEFPEMISKRFYIYEYPENKIKNDICKIKEKCQLMSGKMDYKKYTSKKGKLLKNHIREVFVKYENGKLYFEGDGFLPQQVRIMSNVILNNKYLPIESKYLTLHKVELNEIMKNYTFELVEGIDIDKVKKIEKNKYFYVFYVDKKDKGSFIGKKGKNIKKLKEIYENIVVKEYS